MKHLLLDREYRRGDRLELAGEEFHYLVHVRRYGAGTRLPARSPSGRALVLEIREVTDRSLHAAVAEVGDDGTSSPELPGIVLYQGLPKGKKLEQIVRQTTEAGVAEVVPIHTAHSVVSLDEERGAKKQSRLERIAREASQQSGRATPPRIHPPRGLVEVPSVDRAAGEIGFVFHEKAIATQALREYLVGSPTRILLAVGPEGGFSGDEVTQLSEEKDFIVRSLGSTVLRTETAALYALAAVQTILREEGAWL